MSLPSTSRATWVIDCLGQVHDVPEVGVSLIQLQHRELRVVPGGDAFVAEDPADLVHLLDPADHQPLQMQLEGDPQVQFHIQSVVMGDKGPGRRTARDGVQSGGLHFQISLARPDTAEWR